MKYMRGWCQIAVEAPVLLLDTGFGEDGVAGPCHAGVGAARDGSEFFSWLSGWAPNRDWHGMLIAMVFVESGGAVPAISDNISGAQLT
jgi:hypothetical protein